MDANLKRKMDRHREVNWSEVVRKAIEEKISESERPVDVTLLNEASKDIDALRRNARGWDSTSEIRRWREGDE